MPRIIPVLILLALVCPHLYATGEFQSLEIFPVQAVLGSSALQDDALSALVNPAGLSRLDRLSVSVSAQQLFEASSMEAATLLPYVGVLSAGLYQYGETRKGLLFGWGRELLPFLSVGIGVKTASGDPFGFLDSVLGDIGFLIYPNASMGAAFLDHPMIRDRLTFGIVFQNLGISSTDTNYAENFNFKFGIGYDLREIWTKFWVEENIPGGGFIPTVGLEIVPSWDYLKWLNLRASWDFSATNFRTGVSLRGDDFSVDGYYNFGDHSCAMSFSGYFERSRRDLTVERYEEGLQLYNEAVRLENLDDDDAFDRYRQALDRFTLAVSYDRDNRKAADYRDRIQKKFSDWYGSFLKRGQAFEAKKDFPQALIYYKRAQLINRDDSLRVRIDGISTNAVFLKSVDARRKDVKALCDRGKYIDARREVREILRYVSDSSGDLAATLKMIDGKLSDSVSDLYGQAQSFAGDRKYEAAIERLNTLLSIEPGNDKARTLLLETKKSFSIQKDLETAQGHFKNGEYLAAFDGADSILSKNPDSAEASDLRDRVKKILRDNLKVNLSAGIADYDAQKYAEAVDALDMVLVVDPNNNVALDYKNRALSKLKALKKLESID